MKKFLLPMLAVIIAVGLTAFTAPKPLKTTQDLHWFQVLQGAGDETQFDNNEVEYIGFSDEAPSGEDCDTGENLCVIGFTNSQVVGTQLNGQQSPVPGVGRTRMAE